MKNYLLSFAIIFSITGLNAQVDTFLITADQELGDVLPMPDVFNLDGYCEPQWIVIDIPEDSANPPNQTWVTGFKDSLQRAWIFGPGGGNGSPTTPTVVKTVTVPESCNWDGPDSLLVLETSYEDCLEVGNLNTHQVIFDPPATGVWWIQGICVKGIRPQFVLGGTKQNPLWSIETSWMSGNGAWIGSFGNYQFQTGDIDCPQEFCLLMDTKGMFIDSEFSTGYSLENSINIQLCHLNPLLAYGVFQWDQLCIMYYECSYEGMPTVNYIVDGEIDCQGTTVTVQVVDEGGSILLEESYFVILDDPSCNTECVEEFWIIDPIKGDTLMPGDTLFCVNCTALVAPPLNGGDLPAEYVVTTTVDTTAGVVTYSYEVSAPDCDSLTVVFYGTFGGDCPCLVLTLDDFYLPFADGTTIVIPGDSCGLFDQYLTMIDQEFGNHPNVSSVTKELQVLASGLIKASWDINYGDLCNPDGCRGKRLRYKIFFDFSACGIGLEELQSRTMFELSEDGNTEYFLEVFPNPTSDILNIKTDANKVEIFNVGGGKVREIELSEGSHQEKKLDVSGWPNGIYTVKAGKETKQIIINH